MLLCGSFPMEGEEEASVNDGDNRELLKEESEKGAEGAAATEEPAGTRDTGDGGAPPGLLQMDRGMQCSSCVEGDCRGEGVSELRQGTHRSAGAGWSLESSLKTGLCGTVPV